MPYPQENMIGVFHNAESYHFITPMVAIGDWTASYQPFHIIINLNFPHHPTPHRSVARTTVGEKIIYTVGLEDDCSEKGSRCLQTLLHVMIPAIIADVNAIQCPYILFHCYAGVSRSPAIAAAFLMTFYCTTLENAYYSIRAVRKNAKPNLFFWKALERYAKT